MKYLILIGLFSVLSICVTDRIHATARGLEPARSHEPAPTQKPAQTCSKAFLDEFKSGVGERIRGRLPEEAETGARAAPNFAKAGAAVKHRDEEDLVIPEISDVKACLKAAELSIISNSCKEVLSIAYRINLMINDSESDGILKLSEEEIEFFSNLDFSNLIAEQKPDEEYHAGVEEQAETKPHRGIDQMWQRNPDLPEAGLGRNEVTDDPFKKMADLIKFCRDEDKIPYAEIAAVDEETGYANVDVYKSGQISCTMVAPIVDSKVNFKVPEALKDCVLNSDAMVVSVEQKSADGIITTKKIAGAFSDLTSKSKHEKPKLAASADHTETIDALLATLEEGSNIPGFSAAIVKVGKLANFPKFEDLDPKILEIIAICSGKVDVKELKEDKKKKDDKGPSKEKSNLEIVYKKLSLNIEIDPEIKSSFEAYKNGKVLPRDLLNSRNKASAMCSLVKQSSDLPQPGVEEE